VTAGSEGHIALHCEAMKKPRRTHNLLILVAVFFGWFAGLTQAQAQTQGTPIRIVVAPFQSAPELGPWQIGFAASLQRTLNIIPGVFVPPVGDPVVLADQANRVGADIPTEILQRFSASAFLAGTIETAPDGLQVVLNAFRSDATAATITLSVPTDPSIAFPAITGAALDLLGLTVDQATRAVALDVASQAPTVEGLQPVAVASSRLAAPDTTGLRAASELAPDQSWILAELARASSLRANHDDARAQAAAATELAPGDVEAWTIRGVVEARAGNAAEAERAFGEALALNPVHAVALAGIASLQEGDNAIATYEQALEAYPRLVEAHLGVANVVGGARALQRLRSATNALPESTVLHASILTRVIAAGDPAGAVAYLTQTLENPMSQSPAIYALATELPVERRDDALVLLATGAEQYPDDARIATARARLLRLTGNAEAAATILEPFFAVDPTDPSIANAYALALVSLERIDEARGVLEAASGQSATVRFNLATALLESGLARQAAEEIENDISAEQRDPEVWALYGAALAGSGRLDEARTALDQALALNPDQALARQTLRRLDERESISGDAVDPLVPEARAAFDRGMSLLEQGRNEEAAAELQFAYDLNAETAPLLGFYLANALQRSGQARAAIALYEEARDVFPESATIHNNLGFAWLQLGRYDQALPALREAVRLDPSNARALLNLGLTYYGLSRFADAIEVWDQAVALDPSIAPAIEASRQRAQRQLDATTP